MCLYAVQPITTTAGTSLASIGLSESAGTLLTDLTAIRLVRDGTTNGTVRTEGWQTRSVCLITGHVGAYRALSQSGEQYKIQFKSLVCAGYHSYDQE